MQSGPSVARTHAATAASHARVEIAGGTRGDREPVVRRRATRIAAQLVFHPRGDLRGQTRRRRSGGPACASRSTAVAHQSSSIAAIARRAAAHRARAPCQRGPRQRPKRSVKYKDCPRPMRRSTWSRGESTAGRIALSASRAARKIRRVGASAIPFEVCARHRQALRHPRPWPALARPPRRQSRRRSRPRCTAREPRASADGSGRVARCTTASSIANIATAIRIGPS